MQTRMLGALAALSMLVACAGQGDRVMIPLTMPKGEKATILTYDQDVPDYFVATSARHASFIVKGDVTQEQLAAVAATENACRIYTIKTRPSKLIAVFTQGVLYAAAGFLGVGAGSQAFMGADFLQFGEEGAAAVGVPGAVNGLITLAGEKYTFEECNREAQDMFPEYGIHVLLGSPY